MFGKFLKKYTSNSREAILHATVLGVPEYSGMSTQLLPDIVAVLTQDNLISGHDFQHPY